MHIGIAFFTKNCLEYTQQCLASVETSHPYTVMVVDDFSSDGTKEWLAETRCEFEEFAEDVPSTERKTQDFLVVEDLDTKSLAARWNHAVRVLWGLGCDYVLLCNNDIVFHPETIDALAARMLEGVNNPSLEAVLVTAHNVRDSVSVAVLPELAVPRDDEASEAPHPDFSCMLLDPKAWEQVGGFEEGYVPCYYEDNDFHTMLKIHNLKAISTTKAPYYHYGSVTQNQKTGGLCTSPLFDKNKQFFINKFGGLPEDLNIEELRVRFLGGES